MAIPAVPKVWVSWSPTILGPRLAYIAHYSPAYLPVYRARELSGWRIRASLTGGARQRKDDQSIPILIMRDNEGHLFVLRGP